MLQSLKENSLDLLVQFGNPVVKIGIAFKIESINLVDSTLQQVIEDVGTFTHGSLDSAQQLCERFCRI
jgi:hypothetical protein